jgi:hypothetical protein
MPGSPLYSRLRGPNSRSGRYGEEENLLSVLEMEPRFLGRPTPSLLAAPTELCRLMVLWIEDEIAKRHF